jgi:hypothetical protein
MGVTIGAGTAHLPEHMSSPPIFSGVRVTRSLVLYVCFVDRCLSGIRTNTAINIQKYIKYNMIRWKNLLNLTHTCDVCCIRYILFGFPPI